ncbi:tetratricopeptide repeat protein [Phormidesmis priestleyi ULC007]|uniref:Tetratricopeptide repeat protein n=1 Tax=Phormidesmis priestleyi ULC007 TaxID=1920490 RepID=A0A2T1D0T1_9CYAN|nr:GUN4 domain-containing protein [Phormidesmis priestleyi]PSB14021.1 tetratricopeptide repeat protein [Phormidesmis priestleyi ULC007]
MRKSYSIAKFPCDDLTTIDRLWMQHSNNRFGISIWRDIWLSFGCKVDNDAEHRLGKAVGWYEGGWKFGDKIDFSLSAPVGHLPSLFSAKSGVLLRILGCAEMMHSALAWRFANCSLTELEQSLDMAQPQIDVKYEQRGTTLEVYIASQEPLTPINSLEADYSKASLLLNAKRYAEALESFEALLQIYPNCVDAHRDRGLALGSLGRHEEALTAFETALQLDPTSESAYFYKESALYNLGRLGEALQSYETLLRRNPKSAFGYFRKGIVFHQLRRHEEALDSWEQSLSFDPNNAEAYRHIGAVLDNLQRHDEALLCLNEALRLDPSSALVHHSRGAILDNLGRHEEALLSLDEALRLNPNHAGAYHSRKIVLDKLGQHQ